MTVPPSRALLRRRLVVLAALAGLAGVAACGGDDDPAATGGSDDQLRAGGSGVLTSPLTGEPVDGSLPAHPVVAVKIDNSSSSQPQLGLSDADVVSEELVEGGSTRLNAFFYSSMPEVVGPVRSMRTSDIGIVKPAGAVLVASGGAKKTSRAVDDAEITTYLDGAAGYERDDARPVPYNLMMRLSDLVDTLDDVDPPPPYLPFGDNDMAGAKPAPRFDVAFSGAHTTSFRYEKGTGYTRPGTYAGSGDDFVADTVLVLRVEQGDAGYLDPAGNPVPETIYEGSGALMLFHDGSVVEGTWSKDELKSPLELTTESGEALQVPPGNTWIELAPTEAAGGSVRVR
jgi:hypothetical protein